MSKATDQKAARMAQAERNRAVQLTSLSLQKMSSKDRLALQEHARRCTDCAKTITDVLREDDAKESHEQNI